MAEESKSTAYDVLVNVWMVTGIVATVVTTALFGRSLYYSGNVVASADQYVTEHVGTQGQKSTGKCVILGWISSFEKKYISCKDNAAVFKKCREIKGFLTVYPKTELYLSDDLVEAIGKFVSTEFSAKDLSHSAAEAVHLLDLLHSSLVKNGSIFDYVDYKISNAVDNSMAQLLPFFREISNNATDGLSKSMEKLSSSFDQLTKKTGHTIDEATAAMADLRTELTPLLRDARIGLSGVCGDVNIMLDGIVNILAIMNGQVDSIDCRSFTSEFSTALDNFENYVSSLPEGSSDEEFSELAKKARANLMDMQSLITHVQSLNSKNSLPPPSFGFNVYDMHLLDLFIHCCVSEMDETMFEQATDVLRQYQSGFISHLIWRDGNTWMNFASLVNTAHDKGFLTVATKGADKGSGTNVINRFRSALRLNAKA